MNQVNSTPANERPVFLLDQRRLCRRSGSSWCGEWMV